MAFYDDGKPVGGYGMKSNSDYTIEDAVKDLGISTGGGGELFIVKITVTNTQSGTTITADKTFAEIGEAVRASLPVWALITGLTDGSNDVWNYQLMPLSDFCDAATYSEYQYADFYGLYSRGGSITYIRINSNNDVEKNNIATKHGLG